MMASGPLDERSASRLLAAATICDLMLLTVLAEALTRIVTPSGSGALTVFLVILLGVYLLYIPIVELLLGGRSPGRLCLGLKLRTRDGSRIGWTTRLARTSRRLMSLGLGGLNVNRAAWWDRKSGVAWASPMAPRPISDWRLLVRSGAERGKSFILGALPGWSKDQTIRIGRDEDWADVALPNDSSVSSRHCVLMSRGSEIRLMDYGTGGKGSSHGTFIGAKRLKPKSWYDVSAVEQFKVADVRIRLVR